MSHVMSVRTAQCLHESARKQGCSGYELIRRAYQRHRDGSILIPPLKFYNTEPEAVAAYKDARHRLLTGVFSGQHPEGEPMNPTALPGYPQPQRQWDAPVPATIEVRIETLKSRLAAAEAAKVQEDAQAAFAIRIDHDKALAQATLVLLYALQGNKNAQEPLLARFRKELQPLANSYGVKIVLVGDKSIASLVKQ